MYCLVIYQLCLDEDGNCFGHGRSSPSRVITLISSVFVNINRFSLHSIYRNRLVKAFLGHPAENRQTASLDPFMASLWGKGGRAIGDPSILNLTLNLIGSKNWPGSSGRRSRSP